jgi:hypothetical protein
MKGDELQRFTEKEQLMKLKNANARFKKALDLAADVHECKSEFGGCGYK